MSDSFFYEWRGEVTHVEIVDLVRSYGGDPEPRHWDRIRAQSLGWITARDQGRLLVGFANLAWDGGVHAFLLDPMTRGSYQRRGIGTDLVRSAIAHAKKGGCEWIQVDFEAELTGFYLDACGFRATPAGVIRLRSDSNGSSF